MQDSTSLELGIVVFDVLRNKYATLAVLDDSIQFAPEELSDHEFKVYNMTWMFKH